FAKGVNWGGKALDTDFLLEYASLLPGSNFVFETDKIVGSFIDEILRTAEYRLNSSDDSSLLDFVANFSSFPGKTKQRVVKRFTAKDLKTVDDAIDLSEHHKKSSLEKAHSYGLKLYLTTEEAIESLREVLGVDDYTYQSYADKLATAIEACGIAYYNYHRNNETGIDPGKASLDLAGNAKSIAVSFRIKERIDKGIETVNEWVEGKPEREKQKKVGDSIDFIVAQLNGLPDIDDMPEADYGSLLQSAKGFVNNCKAPLDKIGQILGSEDETYLSISSAVVNNAMGMCVVYVNEIHKPAGAFDILKTIEFFAMDPDLREHFNNNLKTIVGNLAQQQLNNLKKPLNKPWVPQPKKSGCYVATMVYGDYDAPEVLVLQRYRDEVLEKVGSGRLFIKFYYRLSPGFVRRFGRFDLVHQTARFFLNRIVRRLM
ncbi:hypothetical protein KAI46_14980, partial [bacterium]|nr:hypothetical protein [bacterium]